jgi:hypothetical protein
MDSCSGWIRAFTGKVSDYRYDARPSDSLVIPYIDILQFKLPSFASFPHAVKEKAEQDNDFQKEPSCADIKLTYGYQDGKWAEQK